MNQQIIDILQVSYKLVIARLARTIPPNIFLVSNILLLLRIVIVFHISHML